MTGVEFHESIAEFLQDTIDEGRFSYAWRTHYKECTGRLFLYPSKEFRFGLRLETIIRRNSFFFKC